MITTFVAGRNMTHRHRARDVRQSHFFMATDGRCHDTTPATARFSAGYIDGMMPVNTGTDVCRCRPFL